VNPASAAAPARGIVCPMSKPYAYREMNPEERQAVLELRKQRGYPKHSPPHIDEQDLRSRFSGPSRGGLHYRLFSGACFEHKWILAAPQRLTQFSEWLLDALAQRGAEVAAWTVLPYHYHCLVGCEQWTPIARAIGRLHGRSSFVWNGEDNLRGRQVWCHGFDRIIRTRDHFFASLNYVHNNPRQHGLVARLQDWPWSSFHEYLQHQGRSWLEQIWREYPIADYGKEWDP
jgi:putative transposase